MVSVPKKKEEKKGKPLTGKLKKMGDTNKTVPTKTVKPKPKPTSKPTSRTTSKPTRPTSKPTSRTTGPKPTRTTSKPT